MFVSVSLGKMHGIKVFFWFLNSNHRLEQLFGILRSMINGHLNFDCLDLRDRLADATLVQWIYSQYPEWDRSSRKLNNTVDRKNTRSWGKCWNGRRDWSMQQLKVSRCFPDLELDIDFVLETESGDDMLRPYQVQIGVLSGTQAHYNLVDLNEVEDDNNDDD